MNRFSKHSVLAALFALLLAAPAFAQSTSTQFTQNGLTREGTVINNVATASFTDANRNTYAPVSANAAVTVGYLANLDVSAPALQTPTGPSFNNSLPITVTNNGNGTDQFALNTVLPEGITNVRYVVDGVTYPDLASLNAALAAMGIQADASLTIVLLYDVLDGFGGITLPLVVNVTSVRAPDQDGGKDSSTTNITPILSGGVNVAPDLAEVERLPSNGTTYTATFTVQSTQNIATMFDLRALLESGSVLSIVSVNGTDGSDSSIRIPANQTRTITVVYTVDDDALAGAMNTLILRATSQADGSVTDTGSYIVTVIRPTLSMTKTAYRAGRASLIGSGSVLPGERIEYLIRITNGGTADATLVEIVDALPAELTFIGADGEVSRTWNIGYAGGTVTGTLTGSLAPAASSYIWISAEVK